ncbi:hypothetical protein BJX70DRAFT_128690 [Aspergillus crustosus]
MSHRQSCDRCRQQKVRCIRDEAQAQRGASYPDRASLAPCERCSKAGVDCIYSCMCFSRPVFVHTYMICVFVTHSCPSETTIHPSRCQNIRSKRPK